MKAGKGDIRHQNIRISSNFKGKHPSPINPGFMIGMMGFTGHDASITRCTTRQIEIETFLHFFLKFLNLNEVDPVVKTIKPFSLDTSRI